jgi:phage replication O-like protein O
MANPQAEDGHIDIANGIVEHLACTRIPGEAMQCLWVILRKTWGWKKKADKISMGQIATATNMKRQHVQRALNVLLEMNIVTKNGDSSINEWGFNKDYDTWKVSPKKVTSPEPSPNTVTSLSPNTVTGVTNNGDKTVTNNGAHKRNKETITKEKYSTPPTPSFEPTQKPVLLIDIKKLNELHQAEIKKRDTIDNDPAADENPPENIT